MPYGYNFINFSQFLEQIPGLSRTYKLKFNDFQRLTLFLRTFKALNLKSKKFQDFQGCVETLEST